MSTPLKRTASGTAAFTFNLLQKLQEAKYPDLELNLIYRTRQDFLLSKDLFETMPPSQILAEPKGRILSGARQFYRYSLKAQSNTDILHLTSPRFYPFVDIFPSRSIICTFHGAGDLSAPRDFYSFSRSVYNFIAIHQWERLDSIVASSMRAKNEISRNYGIPIDKIDVVLAGADSLWGLPLTRCNLTDSLRDKPFILLIGRFQKQKNILRILQVIKDELRDLLSEYRIIVLAKEGGKTEAECLEIVHELGSTNACHIPYATKEEYVNLMRNAALVIHPSVDEGFGIPAFEAFGEGARLLIHHETPASDLLGGQNGVTTSNLVDSESIIKGILSGLNVSRRSLSQSREFIVSIGATWQAMAHNYVRLYQHLLCNPRK